VFEQLKKDHHLQSEHNIQVETLALLVQEAVVDTPAVEVVVQLALVQTLQQLQLEMEEMD
jgi:hypothetical protein